MWWLIALGIVVFGALAWWFFVPTRPVEMEAGETVFLARDERAIRDRES